MNKQQYDTISLLVAEIEALKGIIIQLTNLIQNESSGVQVTVKGETITIPIAMSPLRKLKRDYQEQLDAKQLQFQAITVIIP